MILLIIGILGAVVATIFLVRSRQDVRSRADTFDTFTPPASIPSPTVVTDNTALNQAGSDSSTPPPAVTNVVADYPYTVEGTADFARASCSWDAVTEAVSYAVKITQKDTGSIIKNEAVNSSETSYVFDVTDGKTYTCEVAAINDVGVQGATGSDEVLCEADVVSSPAPTAAPTTPTTPIPTSSVAATLIPTSPPVSTSAPTPTLPPTGVTENLAIVALGGVVLMILGGLLFLF